MCVRVCAYIYIDNDSIYTCAHVYMWRVTKVYDYDTKDIHLNILHIHANAACCICIYIIAAYLYLYYTCIYTILGSA